MKRAGTAQRSPPARAAAPTGLGPERWQADAGAAGLLRLDIPPHAARTRVFDITCTMTVRLREARSDAWHRMTVTADGRREWQRQVSTQNPGATDSLDVHFRRTVPVGEALRLQMSAEVHLTQRVSLRIEAEEA